MNKYVYVFMLFALLTGCDKYNPEKDGSVLNSEMKRELEDELKKPTKIDYDVSGINNGYEYVDLALSVKWATMNVGAGSPVDAGNYYAWGETAPQPVYYGWETYKWSNGQYNRTKYNSNDGKTTLDLSDDAARQNWGGTWRMPTKAEFEELAQKCMWTDTSINGKRVYIGTSKINGRSIFMPCGGNYYGNSLSVGGGYYWSSTLVSYSREYAYCYILGKKELNTNFHRYDGLNVRAVCP